MMRKLPYSYRPSQGRACAGRRYDAARDILHIDPDPRISPSENSVPIDPEFVLVIKAYLDYLRLYQDFF